MNSEDKELAYERICKMKYKSILKWENSEDEFCKLQISIITNKRIVFLTDENTDELLKQNSKRYFESYGKEITKFFNLDRDNPMELNMYIGDSDTFLFSILGKYYGKKAKTIYSRFNRNIDLYIKNRHNIIPYFPKFYRRINGEDIYKYFFYDDVGENKIKYIIEQLSDIESIMTFEEIIRAAVQNDAYRLPQHEQEQKYWECYKHKDDECWVNCGSANGDTILLFLINEYKFDKIYAFEGDTNTFETLKNNISYMDSNIQNRIELYNSYIGLEGEKKDSFDCMFHSKPVSLINMDIEGAEMGVLMGGQDLIKKQRPVLAVCTYHKASDLYNIPAFINSITNDYFFFLRKYRGYNPGLLNEYVYYCVPSERL